MAYLALQPHVGYGLVAGRAVFLDLRRDRYFALDRLCEDAFRQVRARTDTEPDEAHADRLLATGLFHRVAQPGPLAPATVPVPAASLLDEPGAGAPGWTAAVRAWRSVARARKRLARRPLLEIVGRLRVRRSAARPGRDATAAEAAARRFLAARELVASPRNCLLDALALLDWLRDEAGGATLVFGVRTDPFGAHCWLQTERVLLTDAHDTVGMFVPVLAV